MFIFRLMNTIHVKQLLKLEEINHNKLLTIVLNSELSKCYDNTID